MAASQVTLRRMLLAAFWSKLLLAAFWLAYDELIEALIRRYMLTFSEIYVHLSTLNKQVSYRFSSRLPRFPNWGRHVFLIWISGKTCTQAVRGKANSVKACSVKACSVKANSFKACSVMFSQIRLNAIRMIVRPDYARDQFHENAWKTCAGEFGKFPANSLRNR